MTGRKLHYMNKKLALLITSGSILVLLAGCSKAPPGAKTEGPAGKDAGKQDQTETGSKDAAKEPVTPPVAATDTASQPPAGPATSPQSAGTANAPPAPQANPPQQKVDVDNLPSDMVILTVSGAPVTVGGYRRMFKMQQIQLESVAMSNPQVRANLLQQAKQLKISLTPDEKNKLLRAARRSKAPSDEEFKKFLSEHKVSEADFNKEITDIGVAVKTVNTLLQQTLLNDLVNRELLCKFGKASGFETKAMNKYIEMKHSPQYSQLLEVTKLPSDDLRDEIVKNELSTLMMEKVQKRAVVTDADMSQFYSKNKKQFQHKERIRLSQIIVAAPKQDLGNVQSVRTQVLKDNPKLSEKELDERVSKVMEAQRQKAQAIMVLAQSGKDFAELVNQYTDDVNAKNSKSGGDMGFQERQQLMPELAKAIWPLKAGQIYPGLIQTNLGFVIMKVTAHEGAGTIPLAEVKNQLRALLLQQKQQQTLNNWLRDKRQTAKLVLDPKFAQLLNVSQVNSQTSALNTVPQ